jgi:PGF-CTERM protein
MPARPPSYCVAAVAAVVLAATVAPSLGPVVSAPAAAATTAAASSVNTQPSASFAESVVYEQRGDVANVTVKTSQPATVNIGSPETSFWLQLEVGKGTTKLRVNTYKAGESSRYSIDEMVWSTNGNLRSRQLRTRPIDAPLDAADYHMNVTINGNEQAIGTLAVEERSTRGIGTRIAPRTTRVAELASEDDLLGSSVEPWNDSVAHDEWLFVHVDATGVRGALSKSQLDGDGDIMKVDFRQANPPMNGQGNEFTGASVERVLTPPGTEGFYLVVDAGDHDIEPGDRYEMTFTVPERSPLADERETVSTGIRVVERRVNVDRNGPGNEIVVENETTIRGSTTLTPGTTINVSAREPDPDPFLIPRTVTVTGDRTFAVTMDFSGLEPGREFEIRLTDQGRTIPAVVAGGTTTTTESTTEPPDETTTVTTPEPTTDGSSDGGNGSEPTKTTTTTETTAEGLTQVVIGDAERRLTQQAGKGNAAEDNSGLVPGFGPATAIVALLSAVLLAIRRL